MKILKTICVNCAILFSIIFLKRFCYSKTDGFALYKITSSFSFHPEWETYLPQKQEEEVLKILDQPFYYLARGAQSYVFVSADGQVVIKFFRLYHLIPPLWITALSFPLPLMPYKVHKILSKRKELNTDFQSYKIAYEEMKEETGLLYLHLNKTNYLKKRLKIYDKIGIAYELDLDHMEFLIQKKGMLVYPTIEHLMKTQGDVAAKEAITALIQLLLHRCHKGIFDKDPELNTNFGFLGMTPVQIDVGRFRWQTEHKSPETIRNEIIRITDHFRQWLDLHYPPLAVHLMEEIQKISDREPKP